MRLKPVLPVLPALALAAAVPAGAEATRALRLELPAADVGRFGVENLAGAMRVGPGAEDTVVVTATVHAESEELAASLRLERVVGTKGEPVLRVVYPLDRYDQYRYPGSGSHSTFWTELFGDSSTVKYDGRRVRVSGNRGVLLYADVQVQVPKRAVEASFRNAVGPMQGQDLQGSLRFDTGSGHVALERIEGDVVADTGSGDVRAASIEGSFRCDTGSGDCEVSELRGDAFSCDTGSGNVRARSITARRVALDSGSGDVRLLDADVEEVRIDTGSGTLELEATGKRLARVTAESGSGDVRLRLPADAGFEAQADLGSGDLVSRFDDAQAIIKRREVVGYRRGDGRIRIDVDTGSGDLMLEPLR